MESTNNKAERAPRVFVIYRKICQHVKLDKGRERLSNIFACITTWEQQKLNVYETLLVAVRKTNLLLWVGHKTYVDHLIGNAVTPKLVSVIYNFYYCII